MRHDVGPGEHTWSYPIAEPDRTLTVDSAIDEIADNEAVWAVVTAILHRHLPHIPADALVKMAPKVALSDMLDNLPGISDEARHEIDVAFVVNLDNAPA